MESTHPPREGDDEFNVRLRWGDDGAQADGDEPVLSAAGRPPRAVRPAHMIPADGEDPQLQQIQAALAALRAEVAALRTAVAERPSGDGARPASDAGDAGDLRAVLDELAGLREDVVALKRRVSLRAEGSTERSRVDAELVARLVAERLTGWQPGPSDR